MTEEDEKLAEETLCSTCTKVHGSRRTYCHGSTCQRIADFRRGMLAVKETGYVRLAAEQSVDLTELETTASNAPIHYRTYGIMVKQNWRKIQEE